MASAEIAPIFTQATANGAAKPSLSLQEIQVENTKLKKEISDLKKENATLKKELAQARKRPATSGEAPPPTKKAKTVGQRKKLFEKWAKGAQRQSAHQCLFLGVLHGRRQGNHAMVHRRL